MWQNLLKFASLSSMALCVSIVWILTHSLHHLDSVLNKWDDAGNSVTFEHPLSPFSFSFFLHCSCFAFPLTFFFLPCCHFLFLFGVVTTVMTMRKKSCDKKETSKAIQRWMCSLRFFFSPSLQLFSLKWCNDKIKQSSSQRENFSRNFHRTASEKFLCACRSFEPSASQLSQMKLFKYFWNVLRSHYSWWIINLSRVPKAMSRRKLLLGFMLPSKTWKLINFLLSMRFSFVEKLLLLLLLFLFRAAWHFNRNHHACETLKILVAYVRVSDVKNNRKVENEEEENWNHRASNYRSYDMTAWNRKQMSSLFSYLSLRDLWLEKKRRKNCAACKRGDVLSSLLSPFQSYLFAYRNIFSPHSHWAYYVNDTWEIIRKSNAERL